MPLKRTAGEAHLDGGTISGDSDRRKFRAISSSSGIRNSIAALAQRVTPWPRPARRARRRQTRSALISVLPASSLPCISSGNPSEDSATCGEASKKRCTRAFGSRHEANPCPASGRINNVTFSSSSSPFFNGPSTVLGGYAAVTGLQDESVRSEDDVQERKHDAKSLQTQSISLHKGEETPSIATLTAPPTPLNFIEPFPVEIVDSEFGQRVCDAMDASNIREAYRQDKYGKEVATYWKRGSTPEDAREAYSAKMREQQRAFDELCGSELEESDSDG